MTSTASISLVLAGLAAAAFLSACSSTPRPYDSDGLPSERGVSVEEFGRLEDGRPATAFVLSNSRGTQATVTNFGATLVSLQFRGSSGERKDVVLGFDDVAGYQSDRDQYFGCTTGRVANRIAKGTFDLDGETYTLAVNNGPNHLHGGEVGLSHRLWNAVASAYRAEVEFTYESPNGEEGYPGQLTTRVTYTLTEADELIVAYEAETTARTPVNLTHHSYFNLAGAGSETVLDHVLQIGADRYTETDATLIPTGELRSVEGSPLDFRTPTRVGDRIDSLTETAAIGYDHNYAVRTRPLASNYRTVTGAGPVARLEHTASGRILEIFTDQPGLQLYSGNFLFGQEGKGGKIYPYRSALCLETQGFPNAINTPSFPSIVLDPGDTYRQLTVHHFTVAGDADEDAPTH